jgi:formate dehydrogenase maturation protein FdhE
MATAPRLLAIIKEIKEHLDNNMIVTVEGLKINDSHLRESIIDAILRAEGYRL